MNTISTKMKIIFITSLLVVIFIIIFAMSLFSSASPTQNISLSPTLFPNQPNTRVTDAIDDIYSDKYKKEAEKINLQEKSQLEKDNAVSRFMDSLPYKGALISVSYALSNNTITVTIPKNQQIQGNQEFDTLLVSRGIASRSWIQHLVIRVQ